MSTGTGELPSAAASRERRGFLFVVAAINLLFLAVDVVLRFPHPAAVIAGRLGVSAGLLWLVVRLGRPIATARLRTLLGLASVLLTGSFGLLAWGAGGHAGPYLGFMPLLPLVVTVAIPDEPIVPVLVGLTGGACGIAMEAASGAPAAHLALWILAFGSSTLYGWAGTFLFRRMRLQERDAGVQATQARREVEAALGQSRRNEALYRAMAASFPDGVMGLFGPELRFLLADGNVPAWGVGPSQLLGRSARDFLPAEIAERVEAGQRAALDGTRRTLEFRFGGRDVVLSLHPVHGGGGEVILGLALAQDVTERRALETRVAVSSRLAAMGTLVAGVAHEINNPLAGAMASHGIVAEEVSSIRRELDGASEVDRAALGRRLAEIEAILHDAVAGERRIAGIVKDLSLLGRPDTRRAPIGLVSVVENAMRWLPPSLGRTVTIRVENEGAPQVLAAEGQITQVLVNLVTNAVQSVPDGRPPEVQIRIGSGSPGNACVEVTDNGAGVPEEVLPRIFDPFFTTRETGKGMGLGLAISHAIVTAHRGAITVRTTPGHGSTFRVELPAAA